MTCEEIIGSYITQLKGEFACLPSGDRIRLVTPYLYPDHDRIELFIRPHGNDVTVSDLGETLRYLDTVGMEVIENPVRNFKATRIAEGLGVQIERGIILKRGKAKDIGELVFDVASACKAIGDLVYSGKAYEPAIFEDEVSDYLFTHDIKTEPNVLVQGRSQTPPYRISLRATIGNKEALIATISPKTASASIKRIDHVFRIWADVNGEREKYTLFNDEVTVVRKGDIELLQQHSRVHRWSNRKFFVEDLKGLESRELVN